ncbi:nudix hydrolase 26, chloroplastic-like isoform X2 [Hibiscus syriacus]|uniref:nudix hydrolase 26, chloroplastic-like isoform X2 n=1 Tax=Hibiscus syriacus TaxID=106335 RepID=UPI001924C0F7|nr:nudix hydrolase 26, chloroplastic-like isoform X2 [Hibiscus syriacus]
MALVWRSFSLCFPLHHFSVPSKPISFIPQYPSSSSPFLNHRKPQPLTLFSCTCSSTSSSMETPPQGYRRNVGICLINSSKKIFSASRLDIPNAWQMPQVPFWLTYDFPPEVREKLKHQWGSDWKGQAQKWFLLKFTGKEEEINLLGDGTEKPEFGEWSWMTLEQIVELAVDFKKPVYKKVLEVFTPYLH